MIRPGKLTSRLFAEGSHFLGCPIPIICGAMTWVSEPRLVAKVCNEGAFACLAGGGAPPDILLEQIEETRRLTKGPFGVNLITISPAYREQLAALLQHPAPYVVFAGGIPKDEDIGAVKATGAKALCFAPTATLAKRLVSAGADALVLEGREAGGHVGPVVLNILLQQILFLNLPVPVFVAGGLWTGRLCAHLFLMGAAGVQLGTRFAASTDSCAHEKFKQAYQEASARDAVVTPQFDKRIPVAPVRALRNEACEEFDRLQMEMIGRLNIGELSRTQAQEQLEQFWTGGLRRAVQYGDVASGSVMAGQAVGLVSRLESVHDILTDLLDGMESELQAVQGKLALGTNAKI